MPEKPGYLWPVMILAAAAISTASIMILMSRSLGVPPLAIALYRLSLSAAIMAPFFFLAKRRTPIVLKDLGWMALAGTFLALHFGLWIYSLDKTSLTSSVVLVTVNPLFVSILGWALFKEHVTKALIYAVIIVLAGGALIGAGASTSAPGGRLGNLLALGGALMASGYLLTGRMVRRNTDIVTYTTVCYTVTSVLLLAACLVAGERITGFPGRAYLLLLLLAIGPQLLGHSLFNWGLKHLPTSTIAMLIITEPVGATVLGLALLHTVPNAYEIAGGSLILAGVYLTVRQPGKAE